MIYIHVKVGRGSGGKTPAGGGGDLRSPRDRNNSPRRTRKAKSSDGDDAKPRRTRKTKGDGDEPEKPRRSRAKKTEAKKETPRRASRSRMKKTADAPESPMAELDPAREAAESIFATLDRQS